MFKEVTIGAWLAIPASAGVAHLLHLSVLPAVISGFGIAMFCTVMSLFGGEE